MSRGRCPKSATLERLQSDAVFFALIIFLAADDADFRGNPELEMSYKRLLLAGIGFGIFAKPRIDFARISADCIACKSANWSTEFAEAFNLTSDGRRSKPNVWTLWLPTGRIPTS